MEAERSKALQSLNAMASEPYYLFHFLAFFSYFAVRSSAAQVLVPSVADRLLHREIQAVLAFSVLTSIKMVREETWESFIGDTLFFAKIFLVALALIMDKYLALWYIVVFSVIYILTQQPAFEGLGACNKLTPLQLEALLTEGNTSRFWLKGMNKNDNYHRPKFKQEKHYFVHELLSNKVEFRSSYSSACIRSSRCFPELSITYSNKNLSFGIVDLGLFPNAAEKFGIYLGGGMDQLPTYILFDNAAGIARLPGLDFEAKNYHPTITKRLISRYFELDRRLLEYVNGK